MKFSYEELTLFYRSLPLSVQCVLILLTAAVLYFSGGVIGSSIGKTIYFLTN